MDIFFMHLLTHALMRKIRISCFFCEKDSFFR